MIKIVEKIDIPDNKKIIFKYPLKLGRAECYSYSFDFFMTQANPYRFYYSGHSNVTQSHEQGYISYDDMIGLFDRSDNPGDSSEVSNYITNMEWKRDLNESDIIVVGDNDLGINTVSDYNKYIKNYKSELSERFIEEYKSIYDKLYSNILSLHKQFKKYIKSIEKYDNNYGNLHVSLFDIGIYRSNNVFYSISLYKYWAVGHLITDDDIRDFISSYSDNKKYYIADNELATIDNLPDSIQDVCNNLLRFNKSFGDGVVVSGKDMLNKKTGHVIMNFNNCEVKSAN